jgi:hypothetical protein
LGGVGEDHFGGAGFGHFAGRSDDPRKWKTGCEKNRQAACGRMIYLLYPQNINIASDREHHQRFIRIMSENIKTMTTVINTMRTMSTRPIG